MDLLSIVMVVVGIIGYYWGVTLVESDNDWGILVQVLSVVLGIAGAILFVSMIFNPDAPTVF